MKRRLFTLLLSVPLTLCLQSCATTEILDGKTVTLTAGPNGKPQLGVTFSK